MIPRYQAVAFIVLLVASVVMGVALWQLRERAHQRLLSARDTAPTQAPEVAQPEPATLLVANDADSSLLTQVQSLPLPQDPDARARAILGSLLDLYAAPDAAHPVPGGATSIAQVFLLPAQNADGSSRHHKPPPVEKLPTSKPRTSRSQPHRRFRLHPPLRP